MLITNPSGIIEEWNKTIFLKYVITKDFIEIGEFTYYDASFTKENPADFENTNVVYFPINNTKLKIGKFFELANKSKFMMNGANHHLKSFTTFPLFWNFMKNNLQWITVKPKTAVHESYCDNHIDAKDDDPSTQ